MGWLILPNLAKANGRGGVLIVRSPLLGLIPTLLLRLIAAAPELRICKDCRDLEHRKSLDIGRSPAGVRSRIRLELAPLAKMPQSLLWRRARVPMQHGEPRFGSYTNSDVNLLFGWEFVKNVPGAHLSGGKRCLFKAMPPRDLGYDPV